MGRGDGRGGDGAAADAAGRVELGPFRLVWREERGQWAIAWYDPGDAERSRRIRRKATGVSGRSEGGRPPQEALDALADHYAAWRRPETQPIEDALVEGLMADWLEHVGRVDEDPTRAADCVAHWLRFFELERRAGRLAGGPYVSDVGKALVERYVAWRKAQPGRRAGTRVSGGTISRELAALRATLRWAWQDERIPSAPFIPDLKERDRAKPRELVYTVEQVARILDAAARLPERHHVLRFTIIMLSTHGRTEAVLELHSRQLQDGLIYFLEPGATQTKKRRSIVPVAPTLAPWLADADGKIIRYRTVKRDRRTGVETRVWKPTASIRTAFEACLVEAGVCEQERDAHGAPVWLPPRRRLGETEPRPKLRGIGNPNTLRHTCSTELHRLGVPEAQIDTAAGHAGTGTNKRNYRHLRPDYLQEFVEGVEAYWRRVDAHTDAHRRPPPSDPGARLQAREDEDEG